MLPSLSLAEAVRLTVISVPDVTANRAPSAGVTNADTQPRFVAVPPQIPHASNFFLLYGTLSHPTHDEPFPPHTPHRSNVKPPAPSGSGADPSAGAHPRQDVPSPPQTEQTSRPTPLLGIPSHPTQVLFVPPHTPHASATLRLLTTPSQPVHVLFVPPQTPHASGTLPLPATPSQPSVAAATSKNITSTSFAPPVQRQVTVVEPKTMALHVLSRTQAPFE
jgi:hypothetical protein